MSDYTSGPLFSLANVRVEFEGRLVLDIPSLEVERGKVTVLVGENGSGKTTFLRLLNGLLSASAGTIEYNGAPLAADGCKRIRAETVMVHQMPLLFRGSVGQNVGFGLRIRAVAPAEVAARTAEALKEVGLPGLEPRRASRLSGGEMQRVAIARALVLRPKVLLLDEPTANVDPASRQVVERMVLAAKAAEGSVVISTHNMELAYRLSDAMLRLSEGQIVPSRENILRGKVEKTDEYFTTFRSGDVVLYTPARQGNFSVAVLPCDDVIISQGAIRSSARNQLSGTVTAIEQEGPLLRVTMDCGLPLQALITPAAASELAMETGGKYMVTFKASAVRLY
jgi:tungstate transport system ATP-binding protein